MPAQSPTLSPTLSAITAGLRGSSSGMPASTLPTRSAPTSAPLVKMPPPRRAKTEISEPPKPRPTSASTASLSCASKIAGEDAVVAGDAEQRQADDEHAGDGAAAERDAAAPGRCRRGRPRPRARSRAPTRSCRCSRPPPDRMPPISEADRDVDVLDDDQRDEQDDADDRDRRVLAVAGRRCAPSWTASEIARIRSLPGDSASSERAVSAPYTTATPAHTRATTTP